MTTVDANAVVGRDDIVLVTLDTLRYDVAMDCLRAGRTPSLERAMGPAGWERRHTPASFTYAAHAAFFAGFLPTPATPGRHARLFAAAFPGSETTAETTWVFDSDHLATGLRRRGYRTVCVGGVGFFDPATSLGRALTGPFEHAFWAPELGVTAPDSTARQVDVALDVLGSMEPQERLFLFVNVSALHQPNHFYLDGAEVDSRETHAAALAYVDGELGRLFDALRARRAFCVCTSDHGTAYGEGGYVGHRVGHEVVWTVPYAQFYL